MGEIYLNDVPVGVLSGTVTFVYTPSYAYGRPGNMLGDVKADRVGEECHLTATICDWKLPQLRKAMGLNSAVAAASSRIRKQEILMLSATANIATAKTMIAGTLKVWKLDRSALYVSSTDYSATLSTVARKSGGALTAGQYAVIEYDFNDAGAAIMKVGGEKTAPNEFELNFVHEKQNGKLVEIAIYRAVVNTDMSIAFNELTGGTHTTHNFSAKALVDTTKPEVQNMFEIVNEADTIIV